MQSWQEFRKDFARFVILVTYCGYHIKQDIQILIS